VRSLRMAAAFLVFGLVTLVGCKNDSEDKPLPGPAVIQIQTDADTVKIMPWDSATVNGTVIVTRGTHPLTDSRVTLRLTSGLGYVEYADPARRDTTDSAGRYHFRFRSFHQTGTDTLVAAFEGMEARQTVTVLLRQAGTLRLTASPDTILSHADFAGDSLRLEVSLNDLDHLPVANAQVILRGPLGMFRCDPVDTLLTGEDGTVVSRRQVFAYGTHRYIAESMGLQAQDSLFVVDSLINSVASVQIHMDTDTLNFLPGDSARCNGWAVVKDGYGNTVEGVRLMLSLEHPFGFIEFVDSQRRDTTDQTGRVYFRFLTYNQAGDNTIVAAVGAIRDTWRLVVRQIHYPAASLRLYVIPNTLTTDSTFNDSVQVRVNVSDYLSAPLPGVPVDVTYTSGRMDTLALTDSNGSSSAWWHPTQFGLCVITASTEGLLDSAVVDVHQRH
jgi:hypothetical protein